LPKPAAQWKILPALTNSLEFGGGSARALEPLLKIAGVLNEEEYQEQVVPTIVKLFANTDRQMRIPLLERLPLMVEHLSSKVINDSIFQHLSIGFADTSVILREMTVKSIVPLAPKLVPRTMQLVMRAFAKLQLDEEAAIRTNTTICLGKIAAHIDPPTREKVLIPACCRALKDPFPPGRAAGLMSLTATQQFHSSIDIATKILPNVAPILLDAEQEVRQAALTCLRVYTQRLERASAQLSLPLEQRQAAGGVEDDKSSVDLSNAADKVLTSMSWLTSTVGNAVKEVAGTPHSTSVASAASKLPASSGYGTGAAGAPLAPAAAPPVPYVPPKPAASAPYAPTALPSTADAWGEDDGCLNDAFSMPAHGGRSISLVSINPPSLGSERSNELCGLGSSGAPAGRSVSVGLAGLTSPTLGPGTQLKPPPAHAAVSKPNDVNCLLPSMASSPAVTMDAGRITSCGMGGEMSGGTGLGGFSGGVVSSGSDVFASLGRPPVPVGGMLTASMAVGDMGRTKSPLSGTCNAPMGLMGGMGHKSTMGSAPVGIAMGNGTSAPMTPMGTKNSSGGGGFGDLDPLAMLNQPLPKGVKKVAAARVQDDTWDKW